MVFLTVLFIAFGVALDAFAVSMATGHRIAPSRLKSAVIAGLMFGGFQAAMPMFGWLVGLSVHDFISTFDHWIAFLLLLLMGTLMIIESIRSTEEDKNKKFTISILLGLSIATSIDAFVIGISFALLDYSIIGAVVVIGLVAFTLSFIGVYFQSVFKGLLGSRFEIIGGIILIATGVKIVIERLW